MEQTGTKNTAYFKMHVLQLKEKPKKSVAKMNVYHKN